ncbi:MAG TPA: hypothetical protein VI197_02150 [Polyangiaceae bacterium]
MGEMRGTKRGQAALAAERGVTGALPLLGAPLLAVIATFVLQPKASGYLPEGTAGSEVSLPSDTGDIAFQASWDAVQQALDTGRFDVARALLGDSPDAEADSHWQAYAMMLDCLEHPSNEATAAARQFYFEGAPEDVRPKLFRTCLSAP